MRDKKRSAVKDEKGKVPFGRGKAPVVKGKPSMNKKSSGRGR